MIASRDVELVQETIGELRARDQTERAAAVENALITALTHLTKPPRPDGYITPAQAAKVVHVPEGTIREWVASGGLPAIQIGTHLFIQRRTLGDFLDRRAAEMPKREPPWESMSEELSAALDRVAQQATDPVKSARLHALHDKMEEGEPLTRAERTEMVRLEHEIHDAILTAMEQFVAGRH